MKSQHWKARHRVQYYLQLTGYVVWVIFKLLNLYFCCLAAMKFNFTKVNAILSSDDLSGAPEPFRILKAYVDGDIPPDGFEGKKGKAEAARFRWPINSQDSLLNVLIKLETTRQFVKLSEIPEKFKTPVNLMIIISTTVKIELCLEDYKNEAILEIALIAGKFNVPAEKGKSFTLSQLQLVSKHAHRHKKYRNLLHELQGNQASSPYAGYTDAQASVDFKNTFEWLCNNYQDHKDYQDKLNTALNIFKSHSIEIPASVDDKSHSVLNILYQEGLPGHAIPTNDLVKIKQSQIHADLNFYRIAKLPTEKQAIILNKKLRPPGKLGESDDIVDFIANRPKLFEKMIRSHYATDEMAANYLKYCIKPHRPVFNHCFGKCLAKLVQDRPDIALKMIDLSEFSHRNIFDKSDPDNLPSYPLVDLACQMETLPKQITKLSALKLLERARNKKCFYSFAQMKRMDINILLDAAITKDHFSYIRRYFQQQSANADLDKYPEAVLEECLMEDLNL